MQCEWGISSYALICHINTGKVILANQKKDGIVWVKVGN